MADLPALLALETMAFPEDAYDSGELATALEDRLFFILVAEVETHVAGFLICEMRGNHLHLIDSVVDVKLRRRGIGGALVRQAISQNGAKSACAETRASNLEARFVLENLGFYIKQRLMAYYTEPIEDALVYVLNLGSGPEGTV